MFIDVKKWPLLRDRYNVRFFPFGGDLPKKVFKENADLLTNPVRDFLNTSYKYEVFKKSRTGLVSRSAFSLSSHPGMSSGHWALVGLMVESFLNMERAGEEPC